MQPPRGDRVLTIGLMLCFLGCASAPQPKPEENTNISEETISNPVEPPQPLHLSDAQLPSPPETEEIEIAEEQEPPPCAAPEVNHQRTLDSALEYCQTSNELWEHGDLEGAIDALDTAYSLLLE